MEPAVRHLLVRMYESGAGFVVDGPDMARMVSGTTGVDPKERAARKRGQWRTFGGFRTLAACLFLRVRAWAG